MTLYELYKRIGRQHLKNTRGVTAKVFVNGEEYVITGVRYESGKIIGFETEKKNG